MIKFFLTCFYIVSVGVSGFVGLLIADSMVKFYMQTGTEAVHLIAAAVCNFIIIPLAIWGLIRVDVYTPHRREPYKH